ncbi:uncharacterized protein LOC112054205 [Bicyclus anynana]|uniref:Uncharacterized protein LOC112054205 n=1 Tax=Bicyclus anynana TaxID=110368 RepID=A0ABM3LYU5_BICAN|nr:uncharacterized protein LOC112054205 [Bicyclus anynana]
MWSGEVPARASASPGLLRRRYSMPETIMRKYRLAQQRSENECEDAGRWSATGASSGTRASCAWCGARAAGARREREHMRKSALLRLWGRAGASPARACPCVPCAPCGTRSLDASHSELHTSPRRLRLDTSRDRNSDSSGSPARAISSCTDPITDVSLPREISRPIVPETRIVRTPIDSPTLHIDDRSFTDSSDAFTTSMPTMKEVGYRGSQYAQISTSDYIDGRVSERSISAENEESNMVPYTKPLSLETPYDILEIVVSETLDIRPAAINNVSPEKPPQILRNQAAITQKNSVVPQKNSVVPQKNSVVPQKNSVVPQNNSVVPQKNSVVPQKNSVSPQKNSVIPQKNPVIPHKKSQTPNIDLDEYVSNILVESLNSLTDQLESMNATIGNDRKMSIVEKEIKVKLQNTGVNTIVHLSPTSNNQIIFGNEELYESDNRRDDCNNPRDICSSSNIRESAISIESNNNFTSAESLRIDDATLLNSQPKVESFINIPSDTVNKAVLQQIQKLFQEELQSMEPELNSPDGPMPSISHIEISNVDVFIDNNGGLFSNSDEIEVQTQRNASEYEVLGGVGAGNYFEENDDNAIVPRFSAFPHTESMEVNTSSSEDAELLGSDCTSLVDSLDDPNSPRSILLRRSFNNNKRSELVRSAIDVLDLLPENADKHDITSPKEKGEAFFIRIKDDNCDCEKENMIVADHMPETIKQRLFKRHRKRELRMECARRSKVKQLKRDLENENLQNQKEVYRSKKELEKECMAIINALIDDVIAKIAQDEYKCMRISQRSNKLVAAKSDENLLRKHWKKDSENNNNRNARKLSKNAVSHSCSENLDKDYRKGERLLRGRVSMQTHHTSNSSTDESPPKRIYQKSEIRDGNKCIEILEILEYVNSSQNSDTTNSDENHNLSSRNKKSRIPVPVNEKVQRVHNSSSQRNQKTNGSRLTPPILSKERNGKSSHLLANMLLDAFEDDDVTHDVPVRRASVPCESRARSNSLRFKNVFDIIPEERSSLSIESTDDSYTRRASAPSLSEGLHSTDQDERRRPPESQNRSKELKIPDVRNTGTSPMTDPYRSQVSVGAMTSPIRKSAGTSPIRIPSAEPSERRHYQSPISYQQQKPKRVTPQRREEEGISRTLAPILSHRTASTIFVECPTRRTSVPLTEPTRRLRGGYSESETANPLFRLKRGKRQDGHVSSNVIGSERRSSEEVSSVGDRDRRKEKSRVKDVLGCRRGKTEVKVESHKKERVQKTAFGRSEEDGAEEMWSSSESSGSLLCSLAPAWLTARRRRRRAAPPGEWAVTVAGSCPAALPNDVEMRLRFPDPSRRSAPAPTPQPPPPPPPACPRAVECGAQCSQSGRPRRVLDDAGRLTLTVKKEASDSSIVASKSVKKSSDLLPDLHTYRASRSKTRSSVKTRRGYSLHCWLPEDEPTPIRARNGLAVEGSAIVPHRKPRVPSMSERDLTRGPFSRHLRHLF